LKTLAAEFAYFLRGRARQNLKALLVYCAFLIVMVLVYAAIFRFLMWHLEGREFSLIAGIYWTITVMTTLGFGDITFHSDPGYVFAAIVTISGVLFLLIILPFGMISLFLTPWIDQRLRRRLTYELAEETTGHIVIFGLDMTTRAVVSKLQAQAAPYVVVTVDQNEAFELEAEGFRVICGRPTDAKVQTAVRIDQAKYVIANLSDPENVAICLSVRSRCQTPIAAFANDDDHINLIRQAGATRVVPLHKILGRYLAIRSTTCGALAHVLDSFGDLHIAEIPVYGTPFAGSSLDKAGIRERTGLAVIGIWERGRLTVPTPETLLNENALLVLAGTRQQLECLEQITGENAMNDLIFILGHGRIGCAAAQFLEQKPVPFILIDKTANPACKNHVPIYGDATVRHVLNQAGIDQAKGLIVTTNDDNTNIFLTLASRQLLPHIRLVARANCDESVSQLYLAGADFVVSNASLGANILFNILESKASAFLTEGVSVFRRPIPEFLVDQRIQETQLRQRTGCSIVAIESEQGQIEVSPSPETILKTGSILILIGTPSQEAEFDAALGRD
jgi:Trk K+ transport system NAD-binding subunit